MSDTVVLGDAIQDDYLHPQHGWVDRCPKCGSGTDHIYEGKRHETYVGSLCRECLLMWRVIEDNGRFIISGVPAKPAEKLRTYEIQIRYRPYFIDARNKEEARQKLIKRLKLTGSDAYGIHVIHLGDHAECNEGIPI